MDAYQHFDAANAAWETVDQSQQFPETLTTAHSLLAIAGFLKIIAENTTPTQ